MRAELRSLDSTDVPDGLDAFEPDDPESFSVAVSASIGPADSPGAELFYFTVCSPRWIEQNPPPKGFEFMHSFLVLSRWDYDVLHGAVSDLCLHTEVTTGERSRPSSAGTGRGSSRATATRHSSRLRQRAGLSPEQAGPDLGGYVFSRPEAFEGADGAVYGAFASRTAATRAGMCSLDSRSWRTRPS